MTSIIRNNDSTNTVAAECPSADQVRVQLQRILDSTELQGSARRRALLEYLVKETLADRTGELKGYSVALDVFGRGDGFDPSSDPVVRLEAGRLRRSLDTYYANTGRLDALRITIPKGAYVAHFTWQPTNVVERPAGTELPAPLPSTDEKTAPPELDTVRPRPIGLIAALVAGALLVVAVLSWFWFHDDAAGVADTRGPAIIVLPFEALNTDEDTLLFAASLTQDLISDLMRFPDFRLYSAPASFRQDAMANPTALGRNLGVSYVVKGNVQAELKMIRIGVHLVDASTGQVTWSGRFELALTPNDLLGMRGALSSAVATALGEPYGVVNTMLSHRLTATSEPSMTSYACVLRAYEYRRTFEDALFAPALACLTEAVSRDPDYADAWAMLGWLHLDAVRQDMVAPAEFPNHLAQAQDAGMRAVRLDPGSQRGLEALAAIAFFNASYDEAERLQRKALALNPNDPEALAQLGWRLAVRGNWEDGLPALEMAIARSADPPGWYYHLIAVHDYLEGDFSQALAAAEHSARVGSVIGLSLAAISHAKLGDMDAAQKNLAAMAESWPLLARDPAAAFRKFQVEEALVSKLVEALQEAGWKSQ
jgi:TolB-like protein/tetratricopeptide (TPR) repeat protein